LEARTESIFHEDSYGYRPRRGALDAVAKCRLRCWEKDWVIDLDVQKFFDTVPWDLMVKAVEANITASQKWVLLYVKRWLAAPVQLPDGTLAVRERGTAQGSAVSPVLANLFMHYAFDLYLVREFPAVQFERYADLCRPRHKSAYAANAAAVAVTGAPSTVTRRTISYLTCTASRASKNSRARNAGSVTCSGCGFRHRDSRSAVTFGSSDDPRGAMPPPSRYGRQDNSADLARGLHHDTPQKPRNNQENCEISAR